MEKTKMQKFKKWCSDNSDLLITGTVFTAMTAGLVALILADAKDQQKRLEAHNDWIKDTNNWLNEKQNDGNAVYQLVDERYLVIPNDTKRELVIR